MYGNIPVALKENLKFQQQVDGAREATWFCGELAALGAHARLCGTFCSYVREKSLPLYSHHTQKLIGSLANEAGILYMVRQHDGRVTIDGLTVE